MAELIPNCSHVLHFSDEEVECLQKVIQNQREDLYAFYADQADPNILIKYPPHCINKNQETLSSIIIQQNKILSLFSTFTNVIVSESRFLWPLHDIAYLLLVIMYEKLEFPPYENDPFAACHYYNITFCLHHLCKHINTILKGKSDPKLFLEFHKNTDSNINAEANSIFYPTCKIFEYKQTCIIQ